MIKNHAPKLGLPLLVLALGFNAGCGGESGGLPSGVGGSLQGVKIRTNVLSLSVSDSPVSDDGSVLPEVVTGISESGTSASPDPTRKMRIRLKGASLSSGDVMFDVNYVNAQSDATFFASDLLPAQAAGGSIPMNVRRCYIYDPDQTVDGSGNVLSNGPLKPFLVRLNDPSKDSDGKPVTPAFAYAGDPTLQPTSLATYLSTLNGSTTEQAKVLNGRKVAQYEPQQGVPMRRGTFDVSLEFFAEKDGAVSVDPFFVSYLKSAAVVSNKDVTIKPAGIAGDDAYDPSRRFAKPVTLTVPITGLPSAANYVRVRVKEVDSQLQNTDVTYEYTGPVNASTNSVGFIVINRLRPLAAQVEAFLPRPGQDAPSVAVVSDPPVAVGTTTTSNALTIAPDVKVASFGSPVTAVSRVSDLRLRATGSVVTPVGVTPVGSEKDSLPVPSGVGTQVALQAVLGEIPANQSFPRIDAATFSIAPTLLQFAIDEVGGINPFATSGLRYLFSPLGTQDGFLALSQAPAAIETGTVTFSVPGIPNVGAGTTGDLARAFTINAGLANAASAINLTVTSLPADAANAANGLGRSLVVTTTDGASGIVAQTVSLAQTDAQKAVSLSIVDRGLKFGATADVFSGPDGTGALLASGVLDSQNGIDAGGSGTLAVTSKVTTVVLNYNIPNASGKATRGSTYTPTLTINGLVAPASLFTFTSSDSSILELLPDGSGRFQVVAPKGTVDLNASITATYRGDTDKTSARPVVVAANDLSTRTGLTGIPRAGGTTLARSLVFVATDSVLTDLTYRRVLNVTDLTGAAVAAINGGTLTGNDAFVNVTNNLNPFNLTVQVYSGENGSGVVLADGSASGVGLTEDASIALTNRVTNPVLTYDLPGGKAVRGNSYAARLTQGNVEMPANLFTYASSNGSVVAVDATGTITIPADTTGSGATVTATYRGAAGVAAPPVTVSVADNGTVVRTGITAIPVSGGRALPQSLVLTATDNVKPELIYRRVIDLSAQTTSTLSSDVAQVSVPVQGGTFRLVAEAFSGANGTGALLAGGEANSVSTTDTTASIALTNRVNSASVTYTVGGYPSGRAVRGEVYTPAVQINGTAVPANLFTFVPSSGVTVDPNTGAATITQPAANTTTTATVGVTYKGGGSATVPATTFTIAPNRLSLTANNVPTAFGSVRYSVNEVSGTNSYTGALTGSGFTTSVDVLNNGKNYSPTIGLYSEANGEGVLLARVQGTDFDFTTSTIAFTANLSTGNLVSAVANATVAGQGLEGFAFERGTGAGRAYALSPVLTVDGQARSVTPKVVAITIVSGNSANGALVTNPDGTGVLVKDSPNSTTVLDAQIRIEYRLSGQSTADAPRTKVFNVKIKPASGGIGGTIG